VASYRLQIKPSAVKELEALPPKDRRRIVSRIRKLATDPRPSGSEKLSGHQLYRVRQGNYRLLYTIEDADMVLVVVKIGHRRDVYR
jgi:mRNA interferase RelE/StbE